jgi:L-iditol 2-dehydrogenase
MRQAVMTSPGVIEHGDVAAPVPGPGEVLLRIQRIGVCGSDVHVNHGKHPFTTYPVIQGHEFSAVVESVGEHVNNVLVGSKVTAMPQVVCGTCERCRQGNYHICDHLKVKGFQAPGVAQDLFVTDAKSIVPLPPYFSFEQGAFVEPSAVAIRATKRAGDLAGKSVAVLGAGPIGNLTAQMCRARGATVLITDISDFRLDIAKQCGIEATSRADVETLSAASERVFFERGIDVIFDCAGVQTAITEAVETVKKGGTIVIVAVYDRMPRVNLAVVGDRELQIIGTLMYQYADYEEAVRRIASGDIRTSPLETKHFPFADFAEAYEFIDAEGPRSMKVFIDL